MRRFQTILLMAVFAGGCAVQNTTIDKKRIIQLSAEANYAAVSKELGSAVWTNNSDPELLLAYCGARFAMSAQDTSCSLAPESAPNSVLFGDALWNAWSGRTKVARAIFDQLFNDKDWRIWGAIGLFELAHYTENHQEIAALIKQFQESQLRADSRFELLFSRYQLAYLESTSNWLTLERLLQKYSKAEIIGDPILFSAQSRLLFVKGKKIELAQLLRNVSSSLQRTTIYKFRKADYLVLEKSITDSQETIIHSATLHPEDPDLVLQQVYIELLSNSPTVAQAAWHKLNDIAHSSSNNVRLLLDMALTLAGYHKPEESGRIFDVIDTSNTTLTDFAAFHVLSAWDAVYRGDISQASSKLQKAFDMAPRHVAANWLKALIAKRQEDTRRGVEALEVLFAADPYNKNYRNMIRHFRSKLKTPELEQLYKEVLEREKG